jgi:hypothetical protein
MDIVIVIGLAFGIVLILMGTAGSKTPPLKPQERKPLSRMRVDAIADAAHDLSEQDEVELIRAIARDLKRKRFRRNHGKTGPK